MARQSYPAVHARMEKFQYNFFSECQCNPTGSNSMVCNTVSGQCSCLPNVVGISCDQCADGYYGFGESSGCISCNCDLIGALSSQCDANGQCPCKPGVTGLNCDQCLLGYYNFTANGCQGEHVVNMHWRI